MRKFRAVSTMDVAIVLCITAIFTGFVYKIGKFIIYKCQAYFDSMRIFLVYQKLLNASEVKLSSHAKLLKEDNNTLKVIINDYSYYTYLYSQLSQYIQKLEPEKNNQKPGQAEYEIIITISETNDTDETSSETNNANEFTGI